ncbi:TetR/AcrR family transcriptional regulator [Acidimangrovimonas pyrenivorans]|uniref:TetR/AcrR family transcriptional regulator n=1 Tax=Acidimangrovimonas pyrenivorans TaxID=2030798 RepID=A0ABV7AMI0_9RHOB
MPPARRPLAETPADPPGTFAYPDILVARSAEQPKGARTRAQIQAAACAVLDRKGPSDLTVAAICAEAGISNGTFYIYFADRTLLLEELLIGFGGFVLDMLRSASAARTEAPMRAANSAYYELFRHNRGLMRCLVHHLDGYPEAQAAFHRLNRDWIETVVAAAMRRLQRAGWGGEIGHDELMRRAYALGGMVDQYLASLLLSGDPALVAVSQDREAVLDTLTLIWERGMEI